MFLKINFINYNINKKPNKVIEGLLTGMVYGFLDLSYSLCPTNRGKCLKERNRLGDIRKEMTQHESLKFMIPFEISNLATKTSCIIALTVPLLKITYDLSSRL